MLNWFVDGPVLEAATKHPRRLIGEEEVEVRPEVLPDATIDEGVEIWVLGMVDVSQSPALGYGGCASEDAATLLPIIQQHVAPGTVVHRLTCILTNGPATTKLATPQRSCSCNCKPLSTIRYTKWSPYPQC